MLGDEKMSWNRAHQANLAGNSSQKERMDIVFMLVILFSGGHAFFERNVDEGGEEDMKREG